MRARTKVRFHLARGRNYMKWQITRDQGPPSYVDPKHFQIVMRGCVLKNRKKTAKEIYLGRNKTVCAWVLCDSVELRTHHHPIPTKGKIITFNPKLKPFWTDGFSDLDGMEFQLILSRGRELFAIKT